MRKVCEERCGGRDMAARRLLEVADEEMAREVKGNNVGSVID